jgi:hypothetical protein
MKQFQNPIFTFWTPEAQFGVTIDWSRSTLILATESSCQSLDEQKNIGRKFTGV